MRNNPTNTCKQLSKITLALFIVATIVNITRRKQLEERLVKVIDASPYGQLLVDEHGIIQLINPSLLQLFGYTKEELLGKPMDILLH